MKREIKFKAWDKKSGTMVSDIGGVFNNRALNLGIQSLIDNGYELMQYTGLRDKNGKEIYEGDILDNHLKVEWNQLHCGWALFNKKNFCHELLADEYDISGEFLTPWQINGEVIGNIYENPELL